MKKALSLILLAAQLAVLASCGDSQTSDTSAPDTADSSAPEIEITRENYPDTVPTDLDFGGETLNILARDDEGILFGIEFLAEEENGEILNDAIYRRNSYVEERLNVKLEVTITPGGWNDRNNFMGKVTASAMAADGSIDIVPYYAALQPTLALQNVYYNLLDDNIPHIDLSQPWWYQGLVEGCQINGKLYFITGDIAFSTIAMMSAIAFNRNLADVYLPDADFYQLVRDGKWTFDTLLSYSRDFHHDLDGNTKADEADLYGFDVGRGEPLIFAADVTLSNMDGDVPMLAANNERMTRLVDLITGFHKAPGYAPSTLSYPDSSPFEAGHLLFSHRYVRDIASLREMEDDYGVLPLPKLDEEQKDYQTSLGESYSQVAIMICTEKLEASAAAIELMAAESYRKVTNIYFENVLKVKYARDEDTAEMLDILQAGVRDDFINLFSSQIGSPMVAMRDVLMVQNKQFASTYAEIEPKVNAKIVELYKTLE